MYPGRSEVRLASPGPLKKNKEDKLGPGEAAFSQACSRLEVEDCSMTGFPISWALPARLRSDLIIEKRCFQPI